MKLKERKAAMEGLGKYLLSENPAWLETKVRAFEKNGWFTIDFIDLAVNNICKYFLEPDNLDQWINHYHLDDNISSKNVGIVMAGNIPLVGFHDFLCAFIVGHKQTIKMSSKDNILLKKIYEYLISQDSRIANYIIFSDRLLGCDAYITTGSNNTSRYFEFYFGKYPSIIRKNKTSVAIISGNETLAELEKLADDICLFFGLGCRNVTKLFVPKGYNFELLLSAFSKYSYFYDHKKYRNNFDYYMTLQIMNNMFYMTNNVILLTENVGVFSAISQVHYSFYQNIVDVENELKANEDIQCISGVGHVPFGSTQQPGLFDYADKVDTVAFLLSL